MQTSPFRILKDDVFDCISWRAIIRCFVLKFGKRSISEFNKLVFCDITYILQLT